MLHFEASLAGHIFRDRREVRDVQADLINEEGEGARQTRLHVFSLPATLFAENTSSFGSFEDTSRGVTNQRWVATVFAYILKICTSTSKEAAPPFTQVATFIEEVFSTEGQIQGWRLFVFDERPVLPAETLNQFLKEQRDILEQMKSKTYKRHTTRVEQVALQVHTHAAFYEVAREIGGFDIRLETVDPKETAYRSRSCPTTFFSVESPFFEIDGADPSFNDRTNYMHGDTISIPVCHAFSPECLPFAFRFYTFGKQMLMEDIVVYLGPTQKLVHPPYLAQEVYANITFDPLHPGWTSTKQALAQWETEDFWVDLHTGLGHYFTLDGEKDLTRLAQHLFEESITLVVRAAAGVPRCEGHEGSAEGDLSESDTFQITSDQETFVFEATEDSYPAFLQRAEEVLGHNIPALGRGTGHGGLLPVEGMEDAQTYRRDLRVMDTLPPPVGLGLSAWLRWQPRWETLSHRADGTLTETQHLGSLSPGDVKECQTTWQKAEYHYKDVLLGHILKSKVVKGSRTASHFWQSYETQALHGSVSKHKVDQEYDNNFLQRCTCTQCGKSKSFCACRGDRVFGLQIPSRKRSFGLNSVIANYMVYFVEHLSLLGTTKSGPVSTSQIDWLNLSFIRIDAHRIEPDLHLMPYFTGAGATSKSHTFKGIVEMTLACEEVTRSTAQWLAVHQDFTSCKIFQHEAEQKVNGTQNRFEVNEAESVLKTAITEGKVLSKNFVANPNDPSKRTCITSVCDTRGLQIYAASNNPTGQTQFAMRRRRMEYQKNQVKAAKGHTISECQARQARMTEEEKKMQADFVEFHLLIDICAHYLGDLTFLGLAHDVSVDAHNSLVDRVARLLKQNHGITLEVTHHEQVRKLARAICIVEAIIERFEGDTFTLQGLLDPSFQSLLYIREEHTVAALGLMKECIIPTNHNRTLNAVWDLLVSGHKSVKLHERDDGGVRTRDPNWISVGNGG